MKHVPVLIIAALLAMSANVAAASTPSTPSTDQLEAHLWQLVRATNAQGKRIDALFVRGRAPYTLRFQSGFMSELNLCNHVSNEYRLQGNLLILRNSVQTTALCVDQRLPTQQKLAGKLMHGEGSAPTLALDDCGALVLRNARGDTAGFEPVALQADGR
ncbi:META domain-containing protein [Stenotrophomonas maltophilia]|uniref:META domain-containing protein n=1 Tax=Stenotrophomonas maltophilia TaxID=40324 RepID=UPI000D6835D0|nr:META domain-containing protein [Stenotrophomonas maltophilia]EKT4076084.1 META domain-containing protein [Stenotrophomonas maltophilia]EKT4082339.1 META domain-containing protein [Stenotrophomonas maltophilia]MBA0289478.1 META domain-containing protein [Stenotrophomonas maltophilia]MBA0369943.1 META domain-containing protein [Stenotrophomonas maltophilia]MBA0374530.1 META domain-containing protein [Stenotrophomonas maltophilia]